MDKLSMETPNLTLENVEKIEKLFPNCVKETEDEEWNLVKRVDFDLLRAELWDKTTVEWLDERYRLDWPGKKRSILKANTPITKTLRPVKEDSVDWDNTQNLYIEWDNFEVLKILQESYLWKIKMIYMDPPYNTGNDFIYWDDFSEDSEEYKEKTEQNAEWYRMVKNTESNGRFHSDWLSMMYERIKIARDLLSDNWAIFISIDEHEHSNLLEIMNEIFGENNYIDSIVWDKKAWAKWVPPKNMMVNVHEYIVAYQKSSEFKFVWEKRTEESWWFKNPDNDPRGPWRVSNIKSTTKPIEDAFTIVDPDTGKEYTNTWAFSKESLDRMIKEKRILWKENLPKQKEFLYEMTNENMAIKSSWWVYDAQSTTVYLKKLIPEVHFDNPKPINLMKYLVWVVTKWDDIILDCFSWSWTTAQAVLELNEQDRQIRKFIMMQIQEKIWEDTEAYKAGYKNICEIWKERIRRAAKKIKEETNADIDYGFRVYRVDESCMKDVYYHPSEAKQENLSLFTSNIKEDRTPEDLLNQVILNFWLTLDLPIEEKTIWHNKVFYVAWNSLIACFDENIDDNVIDEIAKDEPIKLVFRDACFKNDAQRINVENKVKRVSPETIIKVI